METLLEAIKGIGVVSFYLLKEMSPYLIFGFLIAGIIYVFLPPDNISRHLGGRNISSVIKASIIGIPLPLCSCGVLPTAISLRKQGAGQGAMLSFLISTPTTGVDSILATYSLLGPLFAIYRVIGAFISAVLSGILINLPWVTKEEDPKTPIEHDTCNLCNADDTHPHKFFDKIKMVFHYAFVELLQDIGKWLLVGILIGGIISYLIPDDFIKDYLGAGWKAMGVMLIMGIPMYVCATGSIPIVVALMLKGMSPGAGLVFLLVGPATNMVAITLVGRELGRKALVVYLFSISVSSIILGMILNRIWGLFISQDLMLLSVPQGILPYWLEVVSALVLLMLIVFNLVKR
jgi:uncharacterized membrane protein YraQ (UPF0718 family)